MPVSSLTADARTAAPRRWLIGGYLALLGVVFVLAIKKPLLLLAVPLVIPGLWAAVRAPGLYTLAAVGLLYINAPAVAVRFHGLPMAAGMALIPFLLAIPIAHRWLLYKRPLVIDPVFQYGLFFVLAHLFSTLFSANRGVSTREVIQTVSEGLLLYLLVFNAVNTVGVLRRTIWVLLFCGAIMGGLCFFQYATKTYEKSYGGFAQIEVNPGFFTAETDLSGQVRQRRLAGPIGEQNRFAQVMLMLVPLGLFRFWDERSGWLRAAALVATALIGLGLMLAFSRAGGLALGVMLVMMTVLGYITLRQSLVVVALVALLLMMLPQFLTRLASLAVVMNGSPQSNLAEADSSIRSRTAQALAAVYMFADHPWTGVGPGMYPYHYQHYGGIVGTEITGVKVREELRQPHVLYLGVAAELGLPGLVALLCMIGALLWRLEYVRRASLLAGRPDLARLAAGFLFAFIGYLTTGFFLHFAYIRYFWLMAALASAAAALVSNELLPKAKR